MTDIREEMKKDFDLAHSPEKKLTQSVGPAGLVASLFSASASYKGNLDLDTDIKPEGPGMM